MDAASPPDDFAMRPQPQAGLAASGDYAALEARLAQLETQLAFVDLLLIPRIRAAAAAAFAQLVVRGDHLPDAATGFFGKEQTRGGVAFRWTEYDTGGRLYLPLVAGMRYVGLLTLVRSLHVSGPEDAVLTIDGRRVPLGGSTSEPLLTLPFAHVPAATGMAEVMITSATLFVPQQRIAGSNDARRLGVQMCSLEMIVAGGTAEPGASAVPHPDEAFADPAPGQRILAPEH